MITETERLELIPLEAEQLRLLTDDLPTLERELRFKYAAEPLEGHFLDIVKAQQKITAEDPENFCFHSFWMIVRKSDRVVVGSADFKAPPDADGRTEIGYGLGKEFEKNGYMTETVAAMCEWAAEKGGVSHVIAETEKDNLPSQNILLRCGFRKYAEEDTYWWIK